MAAGLLAVRLTLALLALLVVAGLFLHYTPLARDDVSLQRGASCDVEPAMSQIPAGRPSPMRIQVSREENCVALMKKPAVQRIGTHLFVRLRFEFPDEMVGCNCSHRAVITLQDLPASDYEVHVYAWP